MTDYYVDAAAAGTGSGLTPANAFVSVLSVAWAPGDRAWVRRTHKEDILSATVFMGVGSVSAGFGSSFAQSQMAYIIGWPTGSGAYFNERPAAGVSASWDTDNQANAIMSTYGLNFPVFCSSTADTGAAGVRLGFNTVYANMCFVNCGGTAGANPGWFTDDTGANGAPGTQNGNVRRVFNNVSALWQNGPLVQFQINNAFPCVVEKFTLIASIGVASTFGVFRTHVRAKRMVVHSASVINALFGGSGVNDQEQQFDLIVNQSNSLSVFQFQNTANNGLGNGYAKRVIRRVAGIRPFSGFFSTVNQAPDTTWRVDDYFGDGPLLISGVRKPKYLMVSTVLAMHNSNRVMRYDVFSEGAANMFPWGIIPHAPILTKHFDLTSGTPINIEVPIYVDSTNVFSPAGFVMTGQLNGAGCNPAVGTNSTILAGSPGLWAGTQPVGGTAYIFRATFTPEETNLAVPFNLYPGPFTVTSGAPTTAYALFSEPYSAA